MWNILFQLVGAQWKSLLRLRVHARHKLLLWKCVWNMLPTQVRLGGIFYHPSSEPAVCYLCGMPSDSLPYLLFQCQYSKISWRESWVLGIEFFQDCSVLDWCSILNCDPYSSIGIPGEDCHWFQLYAVNLLDLLWFQRNQVAHGSQPLEVGLFAAQVYRVAFEHLCAWRVTLASLPEAAWVPPPHEMLKINFAPFRRLLVFVVIQMV